MTIEPTLQGTWIAHGSAGGIPFVAEGDTPSEAFEAALEAVYAGAARRKLRDLGERPCRCAAYPHPHRLGGGDCCGCESAPDCGHWIRVPDYYGTGDHSNVRYERTEK